jgi:hypothetical protein
MAIPNFYTGGFCKTIQMYMLITVLSLNNFFIDIRYILNGPVVRALDVKANDQSSNLTKILKKNLFAWDYLTLL